MKQIFILSLLSVFLFSFIPEEKKQAFKKGDLAPDFTFYDANKEAHQLSNFRGKYVFIDVWGLYCAPCVRAIPELNKIRKEFKGQNIEFIGVCWEIMENFEMWKQKLKTYRAEGIQFLLKDDPQYYTFRDTFRTYSIPAYMIIRPDGKFEAFRAPKPSDELRQYLRQILKNDQ